MVTGTRSYTYNGAQLADGGINQMRFELGDVLVEEPDKTALLTDSRGGGQSSS